MGSCLFSRMEADSLSQLACCYATRQRMSWVPLRTIFLFPNLHMYTLKLPEIKAFISGQTPNNAPSSNGVCHSSKRGEGQRILCWPSYHTAEMQKYHTVHNMPHEALSWGPSSPRKMRSTPITCITWQNPGNLLLEASHHCALRALTASNPPVCLYIIFIPPYLPKIKEEYNWTDSHRVCHIAG